MEKNAASKLLEDFRIAYRTEVEGHAFYKTAAGLIEDERGKNLFNHLAAEELDHIRVISAFEESLKQGGRLSGYDEALKKGSTGEKGLPIYPEKNKMLSRLGEDQNDLNAVTIAMDAEEKAVEFYLGMLKSAASPEEKVLLTKLLEMEKDHLKLLRWEMESLSTNGFWCDHMEYSVEKEVE
jgi:rubrerythrin